MKNLLIIFSIFMIQTLTFASGFSNCKVNTYQGVHKILLPTGKTMTATLMCTTNDEIQVIPVSSDDCCFHRGADGTCYHENPACSGCVCYHRGADGTCYHCSCSWGCP